MNLNRWAAFKKRGFDIVFAIILLVPFGLLLIGAQWLVVKLSDPRSPAFYTQRRVGRGGKQFTIYKIRTMVWNPTEPFRPCAAHDSRVTKIGRCLRLAKLDELPQLWNVLRGEMSVVGPRPYHPSEDPENILRWLVRPGICGWAKLYRLSNPPVNELDHDLRYALSCPSILLDLWIMGLTPFCLLFTTQKENALLVESQLTRERSDVRVAVGS